MSQQPDPHLAVGWPDDLLPAWSAVPNTTLLDFILPRLTKDPDSATVVFDDGDILTCGVLLDRAQRLAGALSDLVTPGDRVALAIGNRSDFLVAYLAILAHRSVVVTLSPGIGPRDAAHVLADSGSVVVIAEGDAADAIEAVRAECPALREVWKLAKGEIDGLAEYYGAPLDLGAVEPDPADLTDIGYTSGTTGMPKALPGRSGELLRYTDVFLRICDFGPGDRILCPLQFHYGDPLWLWLTSLEVGVPLVVMRKFSVSRFFSVARDFRATVLFSVGAIPNLLLSSRSGPSDRDHHLRLAIGVGIPRSQHRELDERFGFPWIEYYGSSESGPAIAMPLQCAERYVGTGALGFPLPDVLARLVDHEGRELKGSDVGELELGGAVLFEGYLNNPESTAEIWDGRWLRTGDLMRRDDDGAYYFAGRRKELIRRGGENLAPAEVEATLRLHPAVLDVAVVPVDDPLRGEEVKAYVQVADGYGFDPEALSVFALERLAAFKVPRYFEHRIEPFPRTPSQRIPKNELKVDGRHRTDHAWDREGQL